MICTKCGNDWPVENYHVRTSRKAGRVSECKACVANRGRAWREKNSEKKRASVIAWHKANPEKLKQHGRKYHEKNIEERTAYQANLRDNLEDPYVRRLLVRSGFPALHISKDLLDLSRTMISIDRLIKENK